MIKGLGSEGGEGSCTVVLFVVEIMFEVPLVGEYGTSPFEVSNGEVTLAAGIEEPGSFRYRL